MAAKQLFVALHTPTSGGYSSCREKGRAAGEAVLADTCIGYPKTLPIKYLSANQSDEHVSA